MVCPTQVQNIILHAETYKKESFMKSRLAYAEDVLRTYVCDKTCCKIPGCDLDPELIDLLMDGAEYPSAQLIDGMRLSKLLIEICKRDAKKVLTRKPQVYGPEKALLEQLTEKEFDDGFPTLSCYAAKDAPQSLNGKFQLDDFIESRGGTALCIACPFIVHSNGSYGIPASSHCSRHYRTNLMYCTHLIQSFTRVSQLSNCATLAEEIWRSFKNYESGWHKKMLHQLSKSQLSDDESLRTKVDELAKRVENLSAKVDTLQAKEDAPKENILEALTTGLCVTDKKLEELSHRVDDGLQALEAARFGIHENDEMINELLENRDTLRNEVGELTEDVIPALGTKVELLEKKIGEADSVDIEDLTERLQELEDSVHRWPTAVHALVGKVDALQAKKETPATIQALSAKVDALQAKQDSWSTRIEAALEMIERPEFVTSVTMIPSYDYAAIRERNRALHRDLIRTYRMFSRLIALRYDTPLAIAVK